MILTQFVRIRGLYGTENIFGGPVLRPIFGYPDFVFTDGLFKTRRISLSKGLPFARGIFYAGVMSEEKIEKPKLPEVASNVLHICRTKKCEGNERYHKVIAHLDEEKAKIECEVCGSKKTYKLKKTTGKRGRARKKVKTPEEIWQELKDQVGIENAVPYSMSSKFDNNAAIDHPKFGLGIVTEASGLKIQVAFSDGEKFLVHNRK